MDEFEIDLGISSGSLELLIIMRQTTGVYKYILIHEGPKYAVT